MSKILLALMLITASPLFGKSSLGEFINAPLFVDIQIESPATNNNVSKSPVLEAGDSLKYQIFAPATAGKQSFGFNIQFALIGKETTKYLSEPTGTLCDCSSLSPTFGQPVISALLLTSPTIPSNGFLGTVEFTMLQNLSEGDVLAIVSATMADLSRDNDALDVSNASVQFTNQVDPVDGDFDLDGDVDFLDFLNFAGNFGHQGPVPSPRIAETRIVTIRDTFFESKIDTISQTIIDTVYFAVVDTVNTAEPISRPEEKEWATIMAEERRNVYWLGVGVEEPGFTWLFVGTGFAVGADAICTNVHVVNGLRDAVQTVRSDLTPIVIAVPADGTGQSAYRLDVNESNSVISFWHPNYTGSAFSADVAIVFTIERMPSFSRLVSSLDAMEIEVGQEIATLGYPGEIDSDYDPARRLIPTSKIGRVNALRPYDETTLSATFWGRIANKMIQHDFDTTGGTSGSPIFNKRGEVVAINNSGFDSGNLNFGIRADEARDLLRAIAVETKRGAININATKPILPK